MQRNGGKYLWEKPLDELVGDIVHRNREWLERKHEEERKKWPAKKQQ